ncbi:MAG: hypothetical protein Q6351_004765 [Candidatus Njordarchaeum guaymaensis]
MVEIEVNLKISNSPDDISQIIPTRFDIIISTKDFSTLEDLLVILAHELGHTIFTSEILCDAVAAHFVGFWQYAKTRFKSFLDPKWLLILIPFLPIHYIFVLFALLYLKIFRKNDLTDIGKHFNSFKTLLKKDYNSKFYNRNNN